MIHRKIAVLNAQAFLEFALVKRMILADEYVSGHCISECTHIHENWICFSGSQDWQKAAFIADENRVKIGQPNGNRLRGAPRADSLFRQCVVNLSPKEH